MIQLIDICMNNFFSKELIEIDLNVDTSKEVIEKLSKLLYEGGYVKDSFLNAVIEREKKYATGIPLDPVGIAIPHTDGIHVKKMAVAVGAFIRASQPFPAAKPIKFGTMGGDGKIDVDLVFLMALSDCKSQISLLQRFAEFFQQTDEIEKIKKAGDKDTILRILKSEIKNKS